jgi:hypothetical protein
LSIVPRDSRRKLAEVAHDFRARTHAIVRTGLIGDVEGLVALVGDDSDELLLTRVAGETPANEDRQPDFWLTLLTDLDRRPIHPD